MTPRRVTLNQLFLQPKVHRVWLLKHRSIRFDLPAVLSREFDSLWQRYCAAGKPSSAAFLENEELTENDALFALFASAVYLDRTMPGFCSQQTGDGIIWSAASL